MLGYRRHEKTSIDRQVGGRSRPVLSVLGLFIKVEVDEELAPATYDYGV